MLRKRLGLGLLVAGLLLAFVLPCGTALAKWDKASPDQVQAEMAKGNARFVNQESIHPNSGIDRLTLAGKENQGDYAVATVLTCSDSRVPVERLFDMGVMDIFVIRVAGNVMKTDEIGSIEYGACHVNTPLVVVLGHTQCGAVTAVTNELVGHGHPLERNIPPLVAPIIPAVEQTMKADPELEGSGLVEKAIEANVWQGIHNLFMQSAAVRDLAKSGKIKVVGAIYHVGTGEVSWLPDDKAAAILNEAENDPARAMNPMSSAEGSGHGDGGEKIDSKHGEHSGSGFKSLISGIALILALVLAFVALTQNFKQDGLCGKIRSALETLWHGLRGR
ncbi:carbonic anhydrase [Maridesulfovibrio sp. FT414]|uniref:carbonic anhydrase n=1 Tax=Maridesulfovibrio sp. FT414 TaxID=2979469 RepID=UPI003D80168D